MIFRLLVVATMLLAGCAIQQPRGTTDTKGQSNDRSRDLYECERESNLASAGKKSQVFESCLKARGYK